MSRRTIQNKSRNKLHKKPKRVDRHQNLSKYWVKQITASKKGITYTHIVPHNKTVKYSTFYRKDMADYLKSTIGRFLPGAF